MAIHPDIEITKGKSFPSKIPIGGIFFHTEHNVFYGWNGEDWQALGAYGLHNLDPDAGSHTGTLDMEHLTNVKGIDGIKMDESVNLTPGEKDRLCIETDTGRVLYDDGKNFIEVGLSNSEISLDHSDLNDAPPDVHHPEDLIRDNDQDTKVITEETPDKDNVKILVEGVKIAKFG